MVYSLVGAVDNLSTVVFQRTFNVYFDIIAVFVLSRVHATGCCAFSDSFDLKALVDSWGGFILCLLLVDLHYYWIHRVSHKNPALWAIHQVHHSSIEYNLLVTSRDSIFSKVVLLPGFLLLTFFGFHPAMILFCATILSAYQFWLHTQSIQKLHPAFAFVFNTPSYHRVHHATDPEYIDRNCGGILIVWDRIFSSFAAERRAPVYGLRDEMPEPSPFQVQFQPFRKLLLNLRTIPLWKERLALLFSFQGTEAGISNATLPETAFPSEKEIKPFWKAYTLVQILILLALGARAELPFNQPTAERILLFALIQIFVLSGLYSIGRILRNKPGPVKLEAFRLTLASFVLLWVLFHSNLRVQGPASAGTNRCPLCSASISAPPAPSS